MRPSTLWQHRGPLLRWGLFLLALATVGAGLYVTLPPEPRWEVTQGRSGVFMTGGDSITVFPEVEGGITGPVRLLDAGTASEVARFLADAPTCPMRAYSDDGRYLVALVNSGQPNTWHVRGIDLPEQREWQAEVRAGRFQPALFSPRCDFVAMRLDEQDDKEQSYAVHDTRSGRRVARVHIPAIADETAFSRDGSAFIVHYHDQDKERHVRAVSTQTGKEATLDGGRSLAVAPAGRCLIADRGDDGIWVGDLADGSWRYCLDGARLPVAEKQRQEDLLLQQHDRLLVHYLGAVRIHYRTKRGGFAQRWPGLGRRGRRAQVIWDAFSLIDRVGTRGDTAMFSPDAQRVLWRTGREKASPQFVCYDPQTGKPLWRRTWPVPPADTRFTPDSRYIVVRLVQAGTAEVLDAATGAAVRTIALPELTGHDAALRCDGRTLCTAVALPEPEPSWLEAKIREWLPDRPEPAPQMVVRVFDFATGAPLGEALIDETGDWWLTDDHRSLIAVYHDTDDSGAVVETVIQGWDIPPRRPLRWIVGVPMALGIGLLSLRYGWRRWRRWRASDGILANSATPGCQAL